MPKRGESVRAKVVRLSNYQHVVVEQTGTVRLLRSGLVWVLTKPEADKLANAIREGVPGGTADDV